MRLLALIPPGTNSRCQYLELLRGAQLAGHQVFFEEVTLFLVEHQRRQAAKVAPQVLNDFRNAYARYLESVARARRADALFTIWLDPLTLLPWVEAGTGAQRRPASFLEVLNLPCYHWWLDAPFWAYEGRAVDLLASGRCRPALHRHIINNPATAEEMRRVLALERVIAQPYGVDTATFRPWPVEPEFDLTINAGPGDAPPTPLMLEQLRKDDPDTAAVRRDQAHRARPALVSTLRASRIADDHASDTLADAWLSAQLSNPDRAMTEKFDLALAAAPGAAPFAALASPAHAAAWTSATAALRTIESWQRAFISTWLSQRCRCLLIGAIAQDWTPKGWPIKGESAGNVAYHELSLLHSRAKVGLNVMRYQDDAGLNPKALEVAASGTPLLQRRRLGFESTFEDTREAFAFDTPAQALETLRALLADPDRRRAVSQAALARIHAEHTWEHKSARLLAE